MIISIKWNLFQGTMFRFQFHVKHWEGNWLILQTSTLPDHSARPAHLTNLYSLVVFIQGDITYTGKSKVGGRKNSYIWREHQVFPSYSDTYVQISNIHALSFAIFSNTWITMLRKQLAEIADILKLVTIIDRQLLSFSSGELVTCLASLLAC